MRVLLDEDVPIRLRHHFPETVVVETVEYRGWKGKKNGELLRLAEADYDVLVTLDKQLPDQQYLNRFGIAVAVLCPRSKRMVDILEILPKLLKRLGTLPNGHATLFHASPSAE